MASIATQAVQSSNVMSNDFGSFNLRPWANTAQLIAAVSVRRPGTVRPRVERLRLKSRQALGNSAAP